MEVKLPFRMKIETEMEKFRALTFWTKEPETIAWIDSFNPDDVFLDIGANIGVYSLYAASKGIDTYAYEPMPLNYIRLVENILLNKFGNIMATPNAFGKTMKNDYLYIPTLDYGKSGSQISKPITETGDEFEPSFKYLVPVGTLNIMACIQHSAHIKIDVDGRERDILEGGDKFFFNTNVKSVLIECNDDSIKEFAYLFLAERGFTADNDFNKLPKHSRIRRQREDIKAENIIFIRR